MQNVWLLPCPPSVQRLGRRTKLEECRTDPWLQCDSPDNLGVHPICKLEKAWPEIHCYSITSTSIHGSGVVAELPRKMHGILLGSCLCESSRTHSQARRELTERAADAAGKRTHDAAVQLRLPCDRTVSAVAFPFPALKIGPFAHMKGRRDQYCGLQRLECTQYFREPSVSLPLDFSLHLSACRN